MKDSEMKKHRGTFDQVVRNDEKVTIVKRYDNKPIFLASSQHGTETVENCKRWSKKDRAHIQVPRPHLVKQYNTNTGGVDMLDRVLCKYAMRGRTRKWTVRVMHHFVDFVIASCWIEYQTAAKENGWRKKHILPYFQFKLDVAENLIYPDSALEGNVDGSLESEEERDDDMNTISNQKRRPPKPLPAIAKRTKNALNIPEMMNTTQKTRSRYRALGCSKLTFVRCADCKMFLCFTTDQNCFMNFHRQ